MMGTYLIKMPDIGEGIAEVELVEWHVQPGDIVTEDQALADVMTDKASVEIPSPVAGRVIALGGQPGDVLSVGAELIRLEVEGDGNVQAGAAPKTRPVAATAPVADATSAPAPPAPSPPAASPAPKSAPAPAAPCRAPGDKPIASPAVRRRAWDLGIELQFVQGSGPAGRISHEDLDACAARTRGPAAQAPAPGGLRYVERHDEQALPVIGLRRKIAQKMQESKRRIPHFTYVEEVDVTEVEALRARLNTTWAAARGRLTLLPFVIRAVVLAVRLFPQINARFDDDAGVVTRHGAVHLGIATQTDGGLMVPVLRHAEALDLWASASAVARLAEVARSGKALREELSGSTITITSLGALGGIVSTPVINHPEVAIVGINRIVQRPTYRDGVLVPRLMMNLSSSFDHRVVDGQLAAEFVQALRGYLECAGTLFVE
jgi:2-oxoisovalerate dehydrogenase E2 component (dihydrolipoyl transacylase)